MAQLCLYLRGFKDDDDDPDWEHPTSNSFREVLSIQSQARVRKRRSSSLAWPEQYKCLCMAFHRISTCMKQWRALRLLNWDCPAMEDLVHVMHTALQVLASKEKGGCWKVRAIHREQDSMLIHEHLHECMNLVCLSLIRVERTRRRVGFTEYQIEERMISLLLQADIARLGEEFRTAAKADVQRVASSLRGDSGKCHLKQILSWPRETSATRGEFPFKLHIPHRQLMRIDSNSLIGSGSYGEVYEAGWLDNTVAVKEFYAGDPSFEKELEALVTLRHPNIVAILGFAYQMEHQRHSIVMERMDTDLSRLLTSGSFPLRVKVSIMLQVARGMEYLHSNKVIHRDLKPGNILIKMPANGNSNHRSLSLLSVKVADFGTARTNFITSEVSHATARVGTRAYRAPEVFFGDKYSKKADVYSFGVVCYQILTGFGALGGLGGLHEDQVGGRPKLPSDCPEILAGLIERCWSTNPQERPPFSGICNTLELLKACLVTGCSIEEVQTFHTKMQNIKLFKLNEM